MSRIISRAEAWETSYEAFQNINFAAFDYVSIKRSMIDYIKTYFPENYNDYIESSEFIAILELFAYLSEILAYRLDLNAHENFLSTAERKQSVLRLAKLISYKPSRNLPARGLVKITSISTTDQVFDSNGVNLANTKIFWNDANNSSWKEQFLLVMNRVLQQEFGSVSPSDRIQVNDVLFELYTWSNNSITKGVLPFSAVVSGESVPMELVPSALNEFGPYENRPEASAPFSILYGSDGLGDASDTTGFFIFAKQGNIQSITTTFDGVTPNQIYNLAIDDINETDIWVNNINSTTNEIIVDDVSQQGGLGTLQTGRYGEWQEVDLANAQNIVFNTNPNRNKYEIETLENDQVRFIFGDGEFADIPSGTFEIWYRTSLNRDIVIPQNTVVNKSSSFSYQDTSNNVQTFSFDFSLINTVQNASPSEDIEHIRRVAPSVYYAQDRMVNGRDYNTFMLQDPSILKLRSVNRTYAGDSKYIAWHDASESYENVKLFGDDLLLYYKDSTNSITIDQPVGGTELVQNTIQPLLSSTDFFTFLVSEGMDPVQHRRTFSSTESASIVAAINAPSPSPFDILYSISADAYIDVPYGDTATGYYWMITVTPTILSGALVGWTVKYKTRHLVAESQTTNFWNTNSADRVIEYDTLNSTGDRIILLKANEGYVVDDNRINDNYASCTGTLSKNWNFEVLGLEQDEVEIGLPDIHQLSILPEDLNGDGVGDFDNISVYSQTNPITKIFDLEYDIDWDSLAGSPSSNVTLPRTYIMGRIDELDVYLVSGSTSTLLTKETGSPSSGVWSEVGTGITSDTITIDNTTIGGITGDKIRVVMKDYIYFNRVDEDSQWTIIPITDTNKAFWAADQVSDPAADSDRFKRERGRSDLNFAWFHISPRFHLVDPSPTNLIDTFIISRGYYTSLRRWLDGKTTVTPEEPTPLQLRTDYNYLLDNKMISDTVILHSGKFKILFGSNAPTELRAKFKIVRTPGGILTDNQVKVTIVDAVKEFFDINKWEFGETFYFTELAAHIHNTLSTNIDSVVLVPQHSRNQFGDMFQVYSREDEIFQPSIDVNDIEIISTINSLNIRQNPS
jgi:hypothetical protein